MKDWLPLVLHYVDPWMSEADIAAGSRWNLSVAKELEVSNFGIVCVTRENLTAPWVLFEAGALAKSLNESRVVPLLLDLDFKDISGPLAQFQAKKVDQSGLTDVIQSINDAANQAVPADRASQLFSALWKSLEDKVAAIPKPVGPAKASRPINEVIEELVSTVRALETRVREADESPKLRRGKRQRFSPYMFEDMMHMSDDPIGILVVAGMMKEDAPWMYEVASEVYKAIQTGTTQDLRREILRLQSLQTMIVGSPIARDIADKEQYMSVVEFPRMLEHMIQRVIESRDKKRGNPPKT